MKNLQQNLLIFLAACLCGLCIWQWYGQTLQRREIESLGQLVYQKAALIQGYTNSIASTDRQIAQLQAGLAVLKDELKTNEQFVATQKRELSRLETLNTGLTNQVAGYHRAVAELEGKLKDTYEGIRKQNEAMKEIVAQRDEYVRKFNDSVKDRNDVVSKYNELAGAYQKLQSAAAKPAEK
jgi:chromosome segregation ATPase